MKRQMIKITGLLMLPALLALVASGCVKNQWQQQEDNEKSVIQQYLKANGIGEDKKTQSGIYYVEQKAGTGHAPAKNNYVIINYVGRYLENDAIHETSYDSLKGEWTNASVYKNYVFGPLKFQYGYSIAGINAGLALMKEGGKARLVIPSNMAFYDYNPLAYDIELIKVISDPVAYEDSVVRTYCAQNGFDSTSTYITKSSIFYKETVTPGPGGSKPVSGDTVYFRFSGKLVDGFTTPVQAVRVFDSNVDDVSPVKYVYGSSAPFSGILSFPTGLKSALDTMRAGTSATAVLPYDQAFADKGLIDATYGYTIVPKYQTVVYDIVVEAIKPGAK